MRAFAAFVISAAALTGAPAGGVELPNVDALAVSGPAARTPLSVRRAAEGLGKPGMPVHVEDRLGVPTFVWAGPPGPAGRRALAAGARPEEAAKRHVADYVSLYGLTEEDVAATTVTGVHDTGKGAIVVSLRRSFDGIEVFRDELRVAMNRRLEPVALSGYLPPASLAPAAPGFRLAPEEAVARALHDFEEGGQAFGSLEAAGDAPGGYVFVGQTPRDDAPQRPRLLQPARVKKVLFHLPRALEPAYYLEVNVGVPSRSDSDFTSYVVSAGDGRVLFRKNLTASDSFSYRVWADTTSLQAPLDGPQGNAPTPKPAGTPDGYQAPLLPPGLFTLAHGPISTGDPWLPSGATETVGNNAEAYLDLGAPDGFGPGDLHADVTAPGVFDRTYDTTKSPDVSVDQRKAALTQLFYDVNFLHDWYYDAGFDERSGNGQTSNYGRGGLANDSLRVEAQDYSGRNNANMSTPADGARPRMQMFIFDGIAPLGLTINAPAAIARSLAVGIAEFGAQSFDLAGSIVLVNDGFGTPSDACEGPPFVNGAALSGKIALVDRGECTFAQKAVNVQAAGAVGIVIANNVPGLLNMALPDPPPNPLPTIPALMIFLDDANLIKSQLGSGVNVTLLRGSVPDRDGTIDNQIVAHEWGHYISNRLISNSAGLGTNMSHGLGEGWADFHALLLTVKPEDAAVPSNTGFRGVYALAGYVTSGGGNGPFLNNGYYFGIRRVPYSTDFAKNALTFKHIANGNPLPTTAPVDFGADGENNAEVHNTGEIWCTMLWECYASLLTDTPRLSFDEARERMRRYLVASYKLTPASPTLLEARDAVLAAALASDSADYVLFARAFARRGAGLRAVAPDRYSDTNVGVVESFTTGNDLAFVSASLDDDVATCDRDGVLDSGETGTLTITLKNVGIGALAATTATVTSTNPALSFPAGSTVSFPASQPLRTTRASLKVRAGTVAGIQTFGFSIAFRDPAVAFAGDQAAAFSVRGNTDELSGQSAADDVESAYSAWTPDRDRTLDLSSPWRRLENGPADHRWSATGAGDSSDQYLISPPLQVAPGTFSFVFRHRHSFETDVGPPVTNYDGGVLELSTDGGATWADIGTTASPGYGGRVATDSGNPIAGRQAYVGTNPSYPDFDTVTVLLGTIYQGKTVRVRFRLATDGGVASPGWDVDDIAFTSIANRPFATLVADPGACIPTPPPGSPSRTAPSTGASGTPVKKP